MPENVDIMEEAILDYLETYGQPQTVPAIAQGVRDRGIGFMTVSGMDSDGELAIGGRLAEMAAAGKIKEVRAGIQSNGEPTLEYAPLAFEG